MSNPETPRALAQLFAELVDGPRHEAGAFILNSGDLGLLGSLDRLSAVEASRSVAVGGTVAAHVQHVRYGLSLMNRWAAEGGNPFADARWDAAWTTSSVTAEEWDDIRDGVRSEARRWVDVLGSQRVVSQVEHCGMTASIGHLAYHLGAIRQIAKGARGPREGTFTPVQPTG